MKGSDPDLVGAGARRLSERKEEPVVIVGAGAAGLMAAIHCAGRVQQGDRRAARVVVLESTRDGGRKILISGGGRCNILPGTDAEARFVTDSSPNTMKKILRSWPLAEQRRFFEDELGIALVLERESGKLFPAGNRAREVRDALVTRARALGVEFRFETKLVGVKPGIGGRWRLKTDTAETLDATAVILATGGLSVPNTGSDGAGLGIAREFGHEIHPCYAALVPLVDAQRRFSDLAGISLDLSLEAPTTRKPLRTHGGFLFTHRGYSGPAVLDLSHLAVRAGDAGRALPREAALSKDDGAAGQRIRVQWTALGRQDWERELAPRRATVLATVRAQLPARLAEALLRQARVPFERSLAELRSQERRGLLDVLTRFELPWTGHEGYRTAEVTGGGVALSEIDPRTMESRRCPGLFLCGEMLDAFGPIGGFNFQWAWATGRAAGLGAGRRQGHGART